MSHREDRGLAISERFEAKFMPEPTSGCWLWTAARGANGYGRFGNGEGEVRFAHRWSYEHYVGAIPAGKFVLHRCDTPSCVNPDHLWIGTQADNLADMRAKGRYRNPGAEMTRCKRGHPFSEENTYRWKTARHCRTCHRRRIAEYRERQSA